MNYLVEAFKRIDKKEIFGNQKSDLNKIFELRKIKELAKGIYLDSLLFSTNKRTILLKKFRSIQLFSYIEIKQKISIEEISSCMIQYYTDLSRDGITPFRIELCVILKLNEMDFSYNNKKLLEYEFKRMGILLQVLAINPDGNVIWKENQIETRVISDRMRFLCKEQIRINNPTEEENSQFILEYFHLFSVIFMVLKDAHFMKSGKIIE